MDLIDEIQEKTVRAQREREERRRQEEENFKAMEHRIMLREIETIPDRIRRAAEEGRRHIVVDLCYRHDNCCERFGRKETKVLEDWANQQGFRTNRGWSPGTQFDRGWATLYIMW